MDRLEAMAMLVSSVELGSLSAAARRMRIPVSTLTRNVNDLEALLRTKHGDGTLAWQQAFATRGDGLSARYAAFSTWAPVEGIGLSQRAATLGMNATLELSERTQLALGVDQRFASRDRSRSATGSFRVVW